MIVFAVLSIIQLYFYIVPQEEKQVRVGLDIGSTTIKCAVLDEHDALIYSTYERHYSHILEKAQELLRLIDADRKSTRLNSSHMPKSRMPSSA